MNRCNPSQEPTARPEKLGGREQGLYVLVTQGWGLGEIRSAQIGEGAWGHALSSYSGRVGVGVGEILPLQTTLWTRLFSACAMVRWVIELLRVARIYQTYSPLVLHFVFVYEWPEFPIFLTTGVNSIV